MDTLIKLADKSIPEQGNPTVDPHTTADSHFNTKTHIYVNTLADGVIARKTKSFPEGAVIVKEKLKLGVFDCTVSGIGGMIKRAPGYDSKHGDWEYFYGDETTPFSSGRIKNCIECHVDARDTDYVFSVWKIAVENDGDNNPYSTKEGARTPGATSPLSEWHDTLEMGSSFRESPIKEDESVLSPDVAP
ncbi:MAG: cytochrome P460 family protein [Verrucomicrobiales bacterium]|nr:cytochrome P460 family protein [Verrucomicrobiales bacterium]